MLNYEKDIYIFIIMILLFPMFVYAEDNNLVLKSITLEKLSEDVEELSPARIDTPGYFTIVN